MPRGANSAERPWSSAEAAEPHAAMLWGARWDEARALVERVIEVYQRREAKRAAAKAHALLKRIVPLVDALSALALTLPDDLIRERWNENGSTPLGLADRQPMGPITNVAYMLAEARDEIVEARDAAREVATSHPGQHLRREIADALLRIAPKRDAAAAFAYLALALRIDRAPSPKTWDRFHDANVDVWRKLLRAGGSGR